MTKSEAFARQHSTAKGMVTRHDRIDANGETVVRVVYGVLRSVYAAQACNYSYREFWV